VKGVRAVHDLHVWSIGTGKNALACHLEVGRVSTLEESQDILRDAEAAVAPLGITHVTIQVETPDQPGDHSPW
jgi:cobalt-zinc-cadmium efflux system protein